VKELLKTNDPVLLSWVRAVLGEAGIEPFVLDTQMSILEGSANAIPRRVMVDEADHAQAVRVLTEAQTEVEGLSLFDE
jgi:hypothetical protein